MTNPFEKIGKGFFKTFEDELWFGKYKGWKIEDVFEKDPSYLEWCLDNIDTFHMSSEEEEKIREESQDENEWDDYHSCKNS
jgi:hypothetical protein